jgi:N-acyl-D-amino-acid deacylase
MVRDTPVLALEDAIRKMTALSAQHVGIPRRGRLAVGQYADLVLFDPTTIVDRATPEHPHELSVGIRRVWVNGQTVFREGQTVRAKAGRMLRRGADRVTH